MASIESSTKAHRDAALHFTGGAGVSLGGLEVVRGIEVVVESAGETR